MKRNLKNELIACCECIVRNAESIADECEFNQGINVTIHLKVGNELPYVTIEKEIIPKEAIDVLQAGDSE